MTLLTYKRTFVICSQNLIKIMIDCPIQHLVSIGETQLACKSDQCELKPVLCLLSFELFHEESKKSCGVPALYREA